MTYRVKQNSLNMHGETAYFENPDIPENPPLILRPS